MATSIPCALGRLVPVVGASAGELRSMRAAVWHKQGIVVVPLDEIRDEWDQVFLAAIATRLYGARNQKNPKRTRSQERKVTDLGRSSVASQPEPEKGQS